MSTEQQKTAIAYLRVSTQRQEISGLGMDAQCATINHTAQQRNINLVGEYIEVESGTKKGNKKRVELYKALEECKQRGAMLIVAKLDRLARDAKFLLTILDSSVEVLFCDMPDANRMTITIYAALAEYEAKLISERTKAALAAKKAKGIKLGNPKCNELWKFSTTRHAHKEISKNDDAAVLIKEMRKTGHTLEEIADTLNRARITTSRGLPFTKQNVQCIDARRKMVVVPDEPKVSDSTPLQEAPANTVNSAYDSLLTGTD